MRLGSYYGGGGALRACVLAGEATLLDLGNADAGLPVDPLSVVSDLDDIAPRLEQLILRGPANARIPLQAVELGPPRRPGKIIGIGLNYRDHAAETGNALPEFPTVFAKFPNAVTGPFEPIRLPGSSAQVDYEGELGVVIGRRSRSVPESQALRAVAGYVIVNDVSARDVQNRTSQWTLGKSFDSFAPMGPFLVTADEVPEPQQLGLSVRVNGELVQDSTTANMVFSVAQLICVLSEVMTLEAGDLIATGTPAGVGAARTPPRFLRDGDIVEVAIDRLGRLRNPVTAAPGVN
jgi:acylpyruvate hydrolase